MTRKRIRKCVTIKNESIMIKYILKKNKNKTSSAYGKWYAYPVVEETMDLEALAKHMKEHKL